MNIKAVNPLLILCILILTTSYAMVSCKRITRQKPIDQSAQSAAPASVLLVESPEAKAIRVAEEFIARNGYTDLPPDKTAISHETVEFAENLEDLLKSRHDSLERKAYGLCHRGRLGTKGGWTIVFRSKHESDDYYKMLGQIKGKPVTKENFPIGRYVTMDANFENLLVEHKIFPLSNIDKKLQ